MKNLKKLSRNVLKKVNGGNYPDMCNSDAQCAAYGLSCGVYEGHDTNGGWIAYRCI